MENLEEVLQALDEFQKMRPSEIPRELEDYLCWVAKTGDPVYQWSLIKTLFREKLTRVMTDFYESCPTLELAPCPNVEHFNYDTMKSNLLERLESFANAPFTLQRICELLTAPRKEYNRVDKFMRAIEKNILVVSTKEPGPIARRSENGEGMVNGSVEEEPPVTQPPQDVEMEYWEKDCASTVTISVHTVENETPLLHTVIPTTTVVKNVFGTEESSHEKLDSPSNKSEMAVSNFIPTTSEFSGVSNLTSQTQSQDTSIAPTMQNLSTIVPEASGIVGDVPEAIMNEDTSSQPSLDLENEENEAGDSTRKLQTTFQAKDFTSSDSKSPKFYLDNSKPNEKAEAGAMPTEIEEDVSNKQKPEEQSKSTVEAKETGNDKAFPDPVLDNPVQPTNDKLDDKIKSDSVLEGMQLIIEGSDASIEEKKSAMNNSEIENSPTTSNTDMLEQSESRDCANTIIISTDEAMHRTSLAEVDPKDAAEEILSENIPLDIDVTKDQNTDTDLTDDPKPIIEEPPSKGNNTSENFISAEEKSGVIITEAIEAETRVMKSIVPDPIPIIEEPKETEPVNDKLLEQTSTVEIVEATESQGSAMDCQQESEEKLMSVETSEGTELQGNDVDTIGKLKDSDSPAAVKSTASKSGQETVELMEVDDEEALSMFQQDEPMEQETIESSKS